jgi:hypothetical protein
MVSPGELRLAETLTEKEAFEPEIADNGAVSYPDVARLLDDADGDPVDVLERFAARGVLSSEFVSKVYVCPECTTEGLQYTTVCPACEAAHTIETIVLEHACGYAGPESEFEGDNGYRCPDCETDLQSDDVTEATRYVCNECPESFETPDDRLRCRACLSAFPPLETTERILYRYGLTADGERWLDRQKGALETITEALQERRFETEVDATVTGESESQSVHVLAEDPQMGEKRIVSLQETPSIERVDAFCAFADSIGAHPVVITTSGTVGENVAARADGSALTLLAYEGEGTLEAEYETVERVSSRQQGLFQRLTAALDVPVRKE